MGKEQDFLALWCAQLPSLRDHARRNGVLARLDRDVGRVREGGSAHRALLKWLPPESAEALRGWADRPAAGIAALPGVGATPGTNAGDYVCPRDGCGRHARRDEHGHVPRCTAFDEPMRPA
ncbi:hypothetical protein [Lentzea sp. E54]|uniref:hypothetical protein n=1 Tax=Lentzea xerophila TaxID=3435883 RepID=UPI003DA587C4